MSDSLSDSQVQVVSDSVDMEPAAASMEDAAAVTDVTEAFVDEPLAEEAIEQAEETEQLPVTEVLESISLDDDQEASPASVDSEFTTETAEGLTEKGAIVEDTPGPLAGTMDEQGHVETVETATDDIATASSDIVDTPAVEPVPQTEHVEDVVEPVDVEVAPVDETTDSIASIVEAAVNDGEQASSPEVIEAAETIQTDEQVNLEETSVVDDVINDIKDGAANAAHWFRQSIQAIGSGIDQLLVKDEAKNDDATANGDQTEASRAVDTTVEGQTTPKEETFIDGIKSGLKRLTLTLGLDSKSTPATAGDDASDSKEAHVTMDPELNQVLQETTQKLNERGERLNQLENKTDELNNQSSNFAGLAKEVANQQADKKWWQP